MRQYKLHSKAMTYSHCFGTALGRGDFKGGSGGISLARIFDHFGGLSPPKNSCIGLAFQSLLTFLPKYFLLLRAIMHCYVVIETFLIIDYTISVLN